MSEQARLFLPLAVLLSATLAACAADQGPPGAVGFTASERLELVADRAEPIVEFWVAEGARVAAGEPLLRLDGTRLEARLAQARARAEQSRAYYDELLAGPRAQTLTAQRARAAGADREAEFRQGELERASALLKRGLSSAETRDQAKAALDAAIAAQQAAAAGLAELEAGTRGEQLRQAQQALLAAEADARSIEIDLERLEVRAPIDGVIDSLPFEMGERPAAGQVVAVMLAGTQALARVYVPEQIRVGIVAGTPAEVRVDGLAGTLKGRVRRIESASTFTPYFALTERDRGRLSFVAEIEIEGHPGRIPDGIPVAVTFPRAGARSGGA